MGNIIGVDLKLDEKYIESAVQDVVRAGIVSALGDPAKLVKAALDQTINQKVDSEGRVTTSSYSGTPYLEYLARQTITSVVREMVLDHINENKAVLKEQMLAMFDAKKFNELSAEAFIQTMLKNVEGSSYWKMPVTINFEKPKDN